MTTYFALTIGPIYETISSARTTREMWASSYLFSYFIRQLVDKFEQKGMEILLPSPAYVTHKNYHGAGIYPDRVIAKSTLKQKDVQDIIDKIIEKLSEDILKHFNSRHKVITHSFKVNATINQQDGILDYLNKYLRIYYLSKELDENTDNIINMLYPYLDAMELQPRILPAEKFPATIYKRLLEIAASKASIQTSPLRLFTDLINGSFLIDDGLGTQEERKMNSHDPKRHFNTMNEIATAELKYISKNRYAEFEAAVQSEINETWQVEIEKDRISEKEGKGEMETMQILRNNFQNEFKTYHNYMAIIHGDGDNVGKIIKNMTNVKVQNVKIGQEEALKAFSKMLTGYAVEATKIVADYGATPVYIGGDDLFFFAPVASINKVTNQWMTILDLIAELDELFNSLIRDQTIYDWGLAADRKPSLSFGISITYRKFPLYEARNMSYSLMKYSAKEELGRNAVATTLLKASGHDISFGFSKKNPFVFEKIRELIHARVDTKENFINSITYKLESLKKVIIPISGDAERVKNFFKNNFNENYKANVSFYESLEEFIVMLADQNSPSVLNDYNYDLLYGTLRFIHFLRSNEKE